MTDMMGALLRTSSSDKMRLRRLLPLAAVLLVVIALAAPAQAAESSLRGQFLGEAWGNTANAKAGDLAARLGRSAYRSCPCHGTHGKVLTNSVQNVDGGDRYRAGKIVSTAQAMKQSGMRAFAQTTSRVTNVSALGGLITADSLEAIATVRATKTSIVATPEGSRVTGLRVNGQSRQVDPGQRINVPGFGYVEFFLVGFAGDGDMTRSVRVDMMRIVITRANDLDIPVGSVITSAHAKVGYTRRESATVVGAAAWGTEAQSTSELVVNDFGRTAPAYLGCFARGTSSGSNRVASTDYPGVFRSGTALSHVHGEITNDLAAAQAISRIENVNLLQGVLTADVIKAVASARVSGTGGTTSFEGSSFVNLHVLGEPLPAGDNVPPNTEVSIPNLGTLTLFATSAQSDADDAEAGVYMAIVRVTTPNTFGLPVGTTLRIGRARAEAHP